MTINPLYLMNPDAKRVVEQRDLLLQHTDWTQFVDVPLTAEQKAAWATYRQALRDITSQEGFPENVQWPSTPN